MHNDEMSEYRKVFFNRVFRFAYYKYMHTIHIYTFFLHTRFIACDLMRTYTNNCRGSPIAGNAAAAFSDRPQTVTNSVTAADGSASEYTLSCTKMIVEEAVNPCDNVKEGNNGSSVPF